MDKNQLNNVVVRMLTGLPASAADFYTLHFFTELDSPSSHRLFAASAHLTVFMTPTVSLLYSFF